jgi:RHS repeat-associated protein
LDHWNTTPEVTYTYGRRGRRIRKQYFTYSGGWVEQSDLLFLYDGWNLVAELDANSSNAKVCTYVWGTDLSGSLMGAGGVGGLLKVTYYGSTTTNAFVAYDGHGNVAALADAMNGSVTARYEYGPFAELIRATGPMAKVNPVCFSTKYTDRESDFLYYGYRYHNPSTGRWLNRDPLVEASFRRSYLASISLMERVGILRIPSPGNEFLFPGNRPLDSIDAVGLTTWTGQCEEASVSFTVGVLFVKCSLRSSCEIGPDKHSEWVSVRARLYIVQGGFPVGYTRSQNTFTSPYGTGHKVFNGFATACGTGWATGPIGFYICSMSLGGAVMEGIGGEQTGLDLTLLFLGIGSSHVHSWGIVCCK